MINYEKNKDKELEIRSGIIKLEKHLFFDSVLGLRTETFKGLSDVNTEIGLKQL